MYRVFTVDENLAESPEQVGTKAKFWFHHEELGRCLFKFSRPTAGEDWSEKVASECAAKLGLPHARYELARSQSGRGVISPSFMPKRGTLIHGNELLLQSDPNYGAAAHKYRVSEHTIDLVLNTVGQNQILLPLDWTPPAGISRAVEVFVGYILLDALIGNTDRHHENWGLIERNDSVTATQVSHLAPTYDHASSLGRNEPEEKLTKRLVGKDKNYTLQTYAAKSDSAFYLAARDHKPLTTQDAFRHVAFVIRMRPSYGLSNLTE